MSRIQAPPVVWAAMAQRGLAPFELRSFEITNVDVYLHLKDGEVIRVEISSLPAQAQPPPSSPPPGGTEGGLEPWPEQTQTQTPEPVKASKAKPRKR